MVKQVGGASIQPRLAFNLDAELAATAAWWSSNSICLRVLLTRKGVTALFAGAKALLWPMYH